MRRRSLLAMLILVFVQGWGAVQAQEPSPKPIQIALWEPAQIFGKETPIHGVRVDVLYGVNSHVRGLSIGLVNRTTGTFKGFEYGLVGLSQDFHGWSDHLVNIVEGEFRGLQTGVYNQSGDAKGLLWGLVNISESMEGLQVGLFNMTERMNGLQVGVVNVITSKEKLPVFPIVNWSF